MMHRSELKEAREQLGLSQEALAGMLGVHRLSVLRWEAGQHKIPPMLWLALKEIERRCKQSEVLPRPHESSAQREQLKEQNFGQY